MASINAIQDQIIEEFEFFDSWMDKYEQIIAMGKNLPEMKSQLKSDENLVKGCQSRVWLWADNKENKLQIQADSDAIITKGLVALIRRILNNQPVSEIARADLYFVERIGLNQHLSPNRANGLASMIKKIKLMALAHHGNRTEN